MTVVPVFVTRSAAERVGTALFKAAGWVEPRPTPVRVAEWGVSFEVTLRSPTVSEMIKTLLDHECLDKAHGKAQSPDQFGTGFQRHFIYSLIEIGPQFVGKKAAKKRRTSRRR